MTASTVPREVPQRPGTRRRVVVVGGGFAGAYCARGLERHLGDGIEILLFDRNNYLLFYPLLVEAGTGMLEPRHTVVSLRAFLNGTRFTQAIVQGFDPEHKVVRVLPVGRDEPLDVEYDQLVLALGSTTLLPPVPGLAEHGLAMKSLADAVALRNRAIALLEAAQIEPDAARRRALLHFVVVGGSLTGAEVAGELDVFLERATEPGRGYRGRDEIGITLVERQERILAALDAELSGYATRNMRARGIDVRTLRSVVEIDAEHVVLDGGERLEAHTTIWCAGIAPHPLIASLPVPTDRLGYIRCTPELRVEGYDDVWAIGDCANNPDKRGEPYPATAQHAVLQGRHLAANLRDVLGGGSARPCVLHNRGTLAALGCRTAVARVFGVPLTGFAAWWLWRTVYLMKMPGLMRKLRLAADWTLDLMFRQEIVHLDVTRHPARTDPTLVPLRPAGTSAPSRAPGEGVGGDAIGDGTAADGTAADGTAADGTAADGTAADGTAADGAGAPAAPAHDRARAPTRSARRGA